MFMKGNALNQSAKFLQEDKFLQELILLIASLLEYIISQILSRQPYINLNQKLFWKLGSPEIF